MKFYTLSIAGKSNAVERVKKKFDNMGEVMTHLLYDNEDILKLDYDIDLLVKKFEFPETCKDSIRNLFKAAQDHYYDHNIGDVFLVDEEDIKWWEKHLGYLE